MTMKSLKQNTLLIFKPSMRKLALFALLSFICIGGAIQSYVFIDDVSDVPKPPFYDLLKPLAIWPSWVFLAAPVHLLGSFLELWDLLKYFPSLSGVRVPLASIAYSYVLSCWTVYTWSKWFKAIKLKSSILLTGLCFAPSHEPSNIPLISLMLHVLISSLHHLYGINLWSL